MAGDRKTSVFGDQAGCVELLWGTRERPSRGPRPALSVERIVRTAIAVADAEGLPGVSMQRVAGELDFTKMSLYRYVPGKTELIALMIDAAMGAPPDLPSGDASDAGSAGASEPVAWRAALREWAERMAEVFHHHPWLLGATTGPRVMGPNELSWVECAVAALSDSGLNGAEQMDAVVVVVGHVRAIAQQAASVGVGSARAKGPEQVMSAALTELLLERTDRYPALTAAVSSAAAGSGRDQAFAFGLDRIFDGLEAYIARKAGEAEPASRH
ncbi:TetR/AcrR family transcriptional regulator [Streptomyces sp. NPDC003077]|uniref:TetR/AcrR family transcriptional regulator n=1 Tax=Streptomyces sp. NPDC003077 TaxID=3154443 RepID=UPI0033B88A13